jgi:hypothetical protein
MGLGTVLALPRLVTKVLDLVLLVTLPLGRVRAPRGGGE